MTEYDIHRLFIEMNGKGESENDNMRTQQSLLLMTDNNIAFVLTNIIFVSCSSQCGGEAESK